MPIEGFDRDGVSDGEIRCAGGSHHISKGSSIYWKMSNWENQEYAAYCRTHALAVANQRYGDDGHPLAAGKRA